jgi:hypothetical protein
MVRDYTRYGEDSERDRILKARKDEISKSWRTKENVATIVASKKPFPKFGIIIIVVAIICLIAVNYVSWIHWESDTEEGYIVKSLYKDLEGADFIDFSYLTDPWGFYSGLFTDDLSNAPRSATYGLMGIIFIGIAITVFGLVDKKRNFSVIKFRLIHFILYIAILIPCVFVISSVIKFIGAYLVVSHNTGFKGILSGVMPEIFWNFPTPYILIISLIGVVILATTILEIDVREIQREVEYLKKTKKKEGEVSKRPFFNDNFGEKT